MPFATDSRFAGYLGPNVTPAPLEGDAWVDLLHDIVVGITGLDTNRVFPRWQPDPPVHPAFEVDWAAVGITRVEADWNPVLLHRPAVDGHDLLQRMETNVVICTFYGKNSTLYASLLRDGLFIDQNNAELRRNRIGVVEVGPFTRAPELFRNRWLDRTDVEVTLRREVLRVYPVLNLLSAGGTITAQPPGDTRLIDDGWDTINQ